MNYKAVIFDMDGTIIDTDAVWKAATQELINKCGITLNKSEIEAIEVELIGQGLHNSCQIIKNMTGIGQSLEDLVQEKKMIAASLMEDGVAFIEGFQLFHERMTQHELVSGVATNADDTTLSIIKRVLKLERFFGDHIYNVTHVENQYKPHPALYLHAAKKLEINPINCIAIEDSRPGIQAAKRAGMFCIGINTVKNKDLLIEADVIIDSYNELDIRDFLY